MFCRMTSARSKLTAAAGNKSQSFLSRESCGRVCSGRKACGTGLIAYDFKYICSSSTLCPYIMFDGVYNCFTPRGIKTWLLLHCMNISEAHQWLQPRLWWIRPSLFYACILNHSIVPWTGQKVVIEAWSFIAFSEKHNSHLSVTCTLETVVRVGLWNATLHVHVPWTWIKLMLAVLRSSLAWRHWSSLVW